MKQDTTGRRDGAPIVVMGAMECECSDLVSVLEEPKSVLCGNSTFYEGRLEGCPVVVVKCLIGMVNAAAAAALAIERYQPRCVILQGTAGGHDPARHRYDIVLGENIAALGSYCASRRDAGCGVRTEDWTFLGAEMRVDGTVRRVQTLHSDETLLRLAESVTYSRGALVRGTVGSGDGWNREIDRIRRLHDVLGTDCEEMEGYAAAQVCAQFGVPMLLVRIISNSELYPEETFTKDTARVCQLYCADLIRAIAAVR